MGGLVVMWLLLGGLLGLAYGLTGRLALPIGLHFTANLAINNVFGLIGEPGETATIVHTDVVGPAWLADIGGAVHIAAVLAAYALLLLWARRRPGGLALDAALARPPAAVPAADGSEADPRSGATLAVRQRRP